MKQCLLIFLTGLCLYACNKTKDAIVAPHPVSDSTKPRIIITENIEGSFLDTVSNTERGIDTTIEDNSFVIYQQPANNNYIPVTLQFKINLPASQLGELSWKIGNDTTRRTGTQFHLDFYHPTNTLTATLVLKWHYPNQLTFYTDTISRVFEVSTVNKLFGSFTGSDKETPADRYSIAIGNFIDSSFEYSINPIHVLGIKNLWKGYPYIMYIGEPKTNGFTTFVTGYERQKINVNGIYYSNPYTLAYLNRNKDSIYIRYSYYKFVAGSNSLIDKVISRTFQGKKD
ncbi:hypothetical protein [Ferruginibacter sp.]